MSNSVYTTTFEAKEFWMRFIKRNNSWGFLPISNTLMLAVPLWIKPHYYEGKWCFFKPNFFVLIHSYITIFFKVIITLFFSPPSSLQCIISCFAKNEKTTIFKLLVVFSFYLFCFKKLKVLKNGSFPIQLRQFREQECHDHLQQKLIILLLTFMSFSLHFRYIIWSLSIN